MNRLVALALGSTLLAGAAEAADPLLMSRCMVNTCVRDGNNTPVGAANINPAGVLLRHMANNWWQMNWTDHGFVNNALFSYTKPNCVGQAYMEYVVFGSDAQGKPMLSYPTGAAFDGQSIWGPTGPPQDIRIASQDYTGPGNAGCFNGAWGSDDIIAGFATHIGTPAVVPPFTIQ